MSVFWHDVRHILKSSRVEFIWMSILVGFLLTILNIFAGVGLGAKEFSQTLNNKLGMYFYIVDRPDDKDVVYSRVIELQKKLEDAGLETRFTNKDKALKTILGPKNANLAQSLKEYGLENALPATLHVTFESKQELTSLKKILFGYQDIITNVRNVNNPTTLKDQEKRNLTAINLGYLIMGSSGVIIIVLLVGIVTFLLYVLKSKFANFHKTIEIKKMLGARYSQITGPLVTTTSILLVLGYVLMIVLSVIAAAVLHHYLWQLLNIDLYDTILTHKGSVAKALALELGVLLLLGWLLSHFYTRRLIKKVAH